MNGFGDSSEWIFETHNCCVCSRPLKESSQYINLVQLPVRVPWKFPTMGNVLTGQEGRGVAVVCDGCFKEGGKLNIKFALEYKNGEVIYHDINSLK